MEQYTNPNYTEYNGCISTTTPSQYFSKSFLDDPIFGLIPEGFDVCYNLVDIPEAIHIEFYLYDSTVPLMRKKDDIASTISIYFEKPYRWSYGWIPFYNNTLHIPELYTNSDFGAKSSVLETFIFSKYFFRALICESIFIPKAIVFFGIS